MRKYGHLDEHPPLVPLELLLDLVECVLGVECAGEGRAKNEFCVVDGSIRTNESNWYEHMVD